MQCRPSLNDEISLARLPLGNPSETSASRSRPYARARRSCCRCQREENFRAHVLYMVDPNVNNSVFFEKKKKRKRRKKILPIEMNRFFCFTEYNKSHPKNIILINDRFYLYEHNGLL